MKLLNLNTKRKNPIQAPEEKKSLFHYIGFHTEEKEIKIKFLRQKLEV